MTFLSNPLIGDLGRFRVKLMLAMMMLVSVITALGLYFAQRNLAASVEKDLQREFQSELTALHDVQALRHAALAELSRALVRKPRIHAALEDNALDLLYPIARDELRDVMKPGDPQSSKAALQAVFYRFLDQKGTVISPSSKTEAGTLRAEEEAQIALPGLFREHQIGYLLKKNGEPPETLAEVIATPIISTETDEAIAALAIGFKPVEPGGLHSERGMRSGVWLNGQLHFPSLTEPARASFSHEVTRAIAAPVRASSGIAVHVDEVPHLLFYQRLNPGSLFPPAYEVSIFSLADLLVRQRQLRWRFVGVGALMLVGGLAVSHFFSSRLSAPVEKLAVDSEENRLQRARAEAALELTNEGLQRAIRFSSDASHQLKTPLTVLRAGLEELLARDSLAQEVRNEVSDLVHQTYRLTSVIDDLLLLSRADEGRLQMNFAPVDLTQLLEAGLDDLGALPDALDLSVETDFPAALLIAGEKRYCTIIVQNLLKNARKYNRPGGRVRVTAREEGSWVSFTIGNTGRPIPAEVQEHVFERFHRGSVGENIPGHGLGLNLARELARLHGGDLRLARSAEDWTEFEARFRAARQPSITAPVLV
ncbi:MAG: HAMP domain-containing histidine kinase [Pedosphaera sp.]|nr:HAMP domain-containing histidine kinase [Pedosphaera sp.]